jgi:subtilisin-like proprotein convertase family protein
MLILVFGLNERVWGAQTTLVASDNFNRANGPIGTNWAYPIASETTFVVSNNMITPAAPDHHTEAYWRSSKFSTNQYSQITLTAVGPFTGVILRADTNQDQFYMGFVFGPNDYRIYARYGGYTELATGSAATWQVGDTLKLIVSGTNDPITITMYQNSTPVLLWRSVVGTDPVPVKNGGSPGICIYSPTGDNLTLDNWQGGNLNSDTTRPSTPSNLLASAVSPSVITLSWSPSTDNNGVAGYLVERSVGAGSMNFTQMATPTGTNFTDTGVTAGTTNNYLVMALDAAGNLSRSNKVTVVAPVPPLPTISVISNQTTLPGIAVGPFPFYISDTGIDPYTLIVTPTSSNTNLLPNANLSVFNLGSTQALTMIPADGQTGTSTITINVSNGVNSTNTSFLLTVLSPGNGNSIFANSSNIMVTAPNATTPYPSTINVSGVAGTITNVMVTLHGMSHSDPGNLNLLLVSPGGQAVVLMSAAVGIYPMTDLTFTLSDQAYYPLPVSSPLGDGNFQPTDYAPNHTNSLYAFPPPAPAPPFATKLGTFNGLSPDGTWSLYVSDAQAGDSGQIAGGWSLVITTVSPPVTATLTSIQLVNINQVENAQLTGIGAADTAYTIQASTNLLNWQAIGTGTAGTNGIFQLNDTNMDQFNRRFYRVAPQ